MLEKFERDMAAAAGWLVALALVYEAKEPLHGYHIAKTLASSAPAGMAPKAGTLYPMLRNLQAQGVLASSLAESPDGPPRRCFTLTAKGRDLLVHGTEMWRQARAWVDGIIGGTDGSDS